MYGSLKAVSTWCLQALSVVVVTSSSVCYLADGKKQTHACKISTNADVILYQLHTVSELNLLSGQARPICCLTARPSHSAEVSDELGPQDKAGPCAATHGDQREVASMDTIMHELAAPPVTTCHHLSPSVAPHRRVPCQLITSGGC